MSDTPETPICVRCGENPGTEKFGESTTMIARGYYAYWCERCVTQVQLEHAEERAKVIPDLKRKLAELGGPWPA